MIQAIIFDFDGLIFDSETHEYRALQELYREHGAELPLEVWGKCIGTHTGFDPCSYLIECTGKTINKAEFDKARKAKYEAFTQNETARPGVENYLMAARELGLKIGLASSSRREWVTTYLSRLGLLDYFECIRTSDDVETVKPDPSLYLRALECLGVQPEHALAFEDSPNGALAAKRAGMYCVIVPNQVTANLVFGEFDLRLESMLEIELQHLLEKLAPKTS